MHMPKSMEMVPKERLGLPPLLSQWAFAYYLSFFFLIFLYIGLTFFTLPSDMTLRHYHLTPAHYHELIIPIVIFIMIIWLASFYGSVKIKSYAALIRGSADGRAFNIIGNGLIVLTLSSPFMSDLTGIFNLFGRHNDGIHPALTVINNYVGLVLMAAALLLIAFGAEKLSALAVHKRQPWQEKVWVAIFIIFSSLYSYFLIAQPPAASLGQRVYYLPHWLVLISIAIPYLYIWYRGFKGAAEIYAYQKNVRGKLYKSALTYLAIGIGLVVASSILTRVIATASTHLGNLTLNPILIIIYGLLIVMAAGFLLIAVGAKRLRQIEEA